MLESLQRRASLPNPGDRDALLANPDAIALPIEQIAEGCVFLAQRDGTSSRDSGPASPASSGAVNAGAGNWTLSSKRDYRRGESAPSDRNNRPGRGGGR